MIILSTIFVKKIFKKFFVCATIASEHGLRKTMEKVNLSQIFAQTYMGLLFEAQKSNQDDAQTLQIWQNYQTEMQHMQPASRLELNLFLDKQVEESNKKRLLKALCMRANGESEQDEKELNELTFLIESYQKMNKMIEDYQNELYDKQFEK